MTNSSQVNQLAMAEQKTPKKEAKKTAAKKAPVKKATTKTTSSKAAAKKPVAKTTTSKTKAAAKKPVTKSVNQTPAKKTVEKAAEKTVVKKEASKPKAAPVKTTAKETSKQTTKKSGGFLSGLALLCSLAALGLSGYMFYLLYMAGQNYQSKNASIQTAVSDVASINEKLLSSDSVIEDLKKQITELKGQQQQMIDVEAVEALVSEQVAKRLEASSALVSSAEQTLDSNEKVDEALPLTAATETVSAQDETIDKEQSTVDTSADVASSGEVELEISDPSVWSWERAKADIKEMFSGLVTFEKAETIAK